MRTLFKNTVTTLLISTLLIPWAMAKGPQATVKENKKDQIAFYSHPKDKTPNSYLPATSDIVPIIRQDEWVKIGIRPSGQVGWINAKQYQQAQNNYYQPKTQSLSVNITRDKDGKPQTHITAYRNGKKLPQKEADKMYHSMQQTPASPSWYRRQARDVEQLQHQIMNSAFFEINPHDPFDDIPQQNHP